MKEFYTKDEVVKALVSVYKKTEVGTIPPFQYCLGHDAAVLRVASELELPERAITMGDDAGR